MPTTAVLACVCTIRFASPDVCIWNISSQRSRKASPSGVKGCGSTVLDNLLAASFRYSGRMNSSSNPRSVSFDKLPSEKAVETRRSWYRYSTSISDMISCSSNEKRLDSAKMTPFSAIKALPEKTRSVVDSPKPLEAYTYPQTQRADCWATSCLRYACLPISSLLAERLTMILAPNMASSELGGTGIHKSSQISTPTATSSAMMIICF